MEEAREVKMFCGTCPDSHCGQSLYFIPDISPDIDCTNCGQRHPTSSLLNITQTDGTTGVESYLKSMLYNHSATKKSSELVKVRGLSNYHCKLVSPLLTHYGMDKHDGKAKLLSELGQRDIFDCSMLANRAFLIEEVHLDIDGYGKDKTGSLNYLGATLELINNGSDLTTLVPLHVDGDGHCLVHAVSRSVVGRELLWHSLRQNLRDHLEQENTKYRGLFHDFIDNDEWVDIIAEADPDFHPATNEPFGLRNIHVFGLANVLHRPIILFDSIEGLQSCGDYSGIFLPALLPPEKCKTNDIMNKPLAIAWSSSARNHYVPLVGIKSKPLPKLHKSMLPKAWGVANQLVPNYVEFDENDCCIIGGSRTLPESYIDRLVLAMDSVFFEKYQVYPELVADVHQFIWKPASALPKTLAQVITFTQDAVVSETLYRCLSCKAVKEVKEEIPKSLRIPGGKLYKMVEETTDGPISGVVYSFHEYPPCVYNAYEDILKPLNNQRPLCELCNGVVREVRADGTVKYANGDRTLTPNDSLIGCQCGYKHYWDGKEYDNLPKSISVPLEWNDKKIEENIFWFDKESDSSLNSNAFEIATGVVQKHFPGEFGSEVLVRKVVDKILRETAVKQTDEEAHPQLAKKYREHQKPSAAPGDGRNGSSDGPSNKTTPTKIILTGSKKKTLHKEELNKSDVEKLTRARIAHHAAYNHNSQKRKNTSPTVEKVKGSSKQGKQDTLKAKETIKHVVNDSTQTKTTDNTSRTEPVASTGKNNPNERKIRLSNSDGRQATVTLKSSATYADLQDSVLQEFGIAKHRRKFRYGYPPIELTASEDENRVLPLSHGDRVRVEEVPDEVKAEDPTKSKEDLLPSESMETAPETISDLDKWPVQEQGKKFTVDRDQLASGLRNFLKAWNSDQWETMQHQPELFTRGGYIFENVVRELGPLRDDQHCSITELPGKKFVYNAKEDRLEICLGQKHVPVQPLDAATFAQSKPGATSLNTEGLGAFSGVLRHRDVSEGRCAFSGTGRTLGSSTVGQNEKNESKESFAEEKLGDIVSSMDVVLEENMASCTDDAGNKNSVPDSVEDVKDIQNCEGMIVDEPSESEGISSDHGKINVPHNSAFVEHANTQEEMRNTHQDDSPSNASAMNEETTFVHGERNDAHETLSFVSDATVNVHAELNVTNKDTGHIDQEMSDAQKTSNEEGTDIVHKETANVHVETKEVSDQKKNVLSHCCSSESNVNDEQTTFVQQLSLTVKADDDQGQNVSGVINEPTNYNTSGCISLSNSDQNPANKEDSRAQQETQITASNETPTDKEGIQPENRTIGDTCDEVNH